MKPLSIRNKIFLVMLLITIALGGSWYVNYFFASQQKEALDARARISILQTNLLHLRQAEKDFMTSNSVEYLAQHQAYYQKYQKNYQQLYNALRPMGVDIKSLQTLDVHVSHYRDRFLDVVKKRKEIGLSADQGYYGVLREAAQAVEHSVKPYSDLMVGLMMARRYEQDFMLQRQEQSALDFAKALSDFRGMLFLSAIENATLAKLQISLRDYQAAFDELMQKEREVGLDLDTGLLGEMTRITAQVEQGFGDMQALINKRLDDYIANSSVVSGSVTFASELFILLALLYLVVDLGKSLRQASHHAARLGKGEWDRPVQLRKRDEIGQLLSALECMRQGLLEKSRVIEQEHRIARVKAELGRLIQGEESLSALADAVVRFLASELKGQVATFYVLTEDTLNFVAGYGVHKKNITDASVALGEGLLGQCALNRRSMVQSKVPSGYLDVVSGTGSAAPGHIVLLPLMWNGQVYGVIEIGAFRPFSDADETLLSACSESIAVAIQTSLSRARIEGMLEQSKLQAVEREKQAQALRASEEALRVQAEELQAQQEALRVTNEELEHQARVYQQRLHS